MYFLRSLRNVKFSMNQQQLQRTFSNEKQWKEVTIPVPWGEIRGKWWGPTHIRPILTLHGWQDNCGSFDRLIPLLNNNVGYLTIDLPGHGISSRLPRGIPYQDIIYLATIKHIKNYLGWPKISIMGHSLGGITSFTYTMIHPEEIDFLVCLDGAKPLIPPVKKNRMARALDKFLRNDEYLTSDKEPPSYSIEEIKKKIHLPNQGSILVECAHHIMARNIAPSKIHPGQYYFTRDPRLRAPPLAHYSQEEILHSAQYIMCPIFMVKAKGASYFEPKENFYEVLDVLKRTSVDCEFHYVEGTHHLHLNNPDRELVSFLQPFINKYVVGDRSSTGWTDKMVVYEDEEMTCKL